MYYIIKKEDLKKLFLFFPIAVLMIAYPSIKELNISSDKIQLTTYQEEYEKNPEDSIVKNKIEELTEKLAPRVNSEEDLMLIGKSNILLQKPEKTIAITEKIIAKRKENLSVTNNETTIKQVYQLKEIAEIQQKYLTEKDTAKTIEKLENLKLDPELSKISSVVKSKYLRKLKKESKNNSN